LKSALSTTSGVSKVEIFTYHTYSSEVARRDEQHSTILLSERWWINATAKFKNGPGGHQPRRSGWIAGCWLLPAGCWLLFLFAVCCLLCLLFACHFNLTVWLLFAVHCYVNFVVGSLISFLG